MGLGYSYDAPIVRDLDVLNALDTNFISTRERPGIKLVRLAGILLDRLSSSSCNEIRIGVHEDTISGPGNRLLWYSRRKLTDGTVGNNKSIDNSRRFIVIRVLITLLQICNNIQGALRSTPGICPSVGIRTRLRYF